MVLVLIMLMVLVFLICIKWLGKLILLVMVIYVVTCMETLSREVFLVAVVSMVMLIYELVLLGNGINGAGDEGISVPGLGINGKVTCEFMGMALVLLAPLPYGLVSFVNLGW